MKFKGKFKTTALRLSLSEAETKGGTAGVGVNEWPARRPAATATRAPSCWLLWSPPPSSHPHCLSDRPAKNPVHFRNGRASVCWTVQVQEWNEIILVFILVSLEGSYLQQIHCHGSPQRDMIRRATFRKKRKEKKKAVISLNPIKLSRSYPLFTKAESLLTVHRPPARRAEMEA